MRFHFDLTNGRTTMPDLEGAEAADLDEAIEQAGQVIEELRCGGDLMDVDGRWELVIRDAGGTERHRISILPNE